MSKGSCAIQRARMEREDMVERGVERAFDALDAKFLATNMTQGEYLSECFLIHEWAREQYGIEAKQ